MFSSTLAALAISLLNGVPELLGQQDQLFLRRRLDRHDWLPSDGPVIRDLADRLLPGSAKEQRYD